MRKQLARGVLRTKRWCFPLRSFSSDVKIYTKTGDHGTSSLFNLNRVDKDANYFSALGDLDEANAQLGLAVNHLVRDGGQSASLSKMAERLEIVQSRLLDVGSAVATPLSDEERTTEALRELTGFDEAHTDDIESWIDELEAKLPPLKQFILPGGPSAACQLHVARAVVRRAERSLVPLVRSEDIPTSVYTYINRLSDYLFVCARSCTHQMDDGKEVTYKKRRSRKSRS